MKSILQALWLFTVSIGNIIVLIIAEAKLVPNQVELKQDLVCDWH